MAFLLAFLLFSRSMRTQNTCADVSDTRFTSCARLLQSIWRERRELAMGRYQPTTGKCRKLGSRLVPSVARTGANFLAADIAKCVRREAAYREIGALIDEARLWGNLLSSQALTFNLFARAKLDLDYATRLCRAMVPDLIDSVLWVAFEHSPGRGDPNYIGDRSAFDLFIVGEAKDGAPAFLAIEIARTLRDNVSNAIIAESEEPLDVGNWSAEPLKIGGQP